MTVIPYTHWMYFADRTAAERCAAELTSLDFLCGVDHRPPLLEVLEALKATEVDDRIRQAAETIYQALIEAELTAVIGAPAPAHRDPGRHAQRAPAADDHHHGRGPEAEEPAAAGRVVLPLAAGTPAAAVRASPENREIVHPRGSRLLVG